MSTKSFLKSKEWKELREKALERDGHKCFICGSDEKLCVHHMLYRRGYAECQDKLWNLITVCSSCHWKIHRNSLGLYLAVRLQELRPEQYRQLISHLRDNLTTFNI